MNIKILTEYGRGQLEELKRSFLKGKLTQKEYHDEIKMLHVEGSIIIEDW